MNRELMEIKDGRLFFDGCDLTQLAEGFGTPLYVYSQNVIKARAAELREAFLDGHPKNRVAYAAKGFCCSIRKMTTPWCSVSNWTRSRM